MVSHNLFLTCLFLLRMLWFDIYCTNKKTKTITINCCNISYQRIYCSLIWLITHNHLSILVGWFRCMYLINQMHEGTVISLFMYLISDTRKILALSHGLVLRGNHSMLLILLLLVHALCPANVHPSYTKITK